MPANFDRDFALWLTQHGNERAVAVNVLEFSHLAWGPGDGVPGSIWVSDFGEEFTAATEETPPRSFTAQPLGFTVDVTADNVSTEQRVQIRMDNVNGLVAHQLRALTDADLQDPVQVTYRAYLDTDRSGPAIDPLTLYVTSATMSRLTVECEATADYLPNVASGHRYTIENFPVLTYL
jgi:hypothetical protein